MQLEDKNIVSILIWLTLAYGLSMAARESREFRYPILKKKKTGKKMKDYIIPKHELIETIELIFELNLSEEDYEKIFEKFKSISKYSEIKKNIKEILKIQEIENENNIKTFMKELAHKINLSDLDKLDKLTRDLIKNEELIYFIQELSLDRSP